ncbi:PLDc N-terminal domain-containing protein [Clostridium sp.]|uniref:PLDc N-terminal domain-containing protein n=1 Tax=Clostridium sp. TaxID=1506 RepID=UPI001A3E7588|nr:PLDc N-terminal domain-containing protein [Clostridium sp.]MBK5241720.1 PLDc_N domain-containing protein [Clostridium sp.]
MGDNLTLLIPIIIIQAILLLIAVVDLVKRDKSTVRGGNKFIWIPVLLVSIIGPIVYLTLGKKE